MSKSSGYPSVAILAPDFKRLVLAREQIQKLADGLSLGLLAAALEEVDG